MSYSNFLTAIHRSLRRIICSCIAPHEFNQIKDTYRCSVVIIFSTPYALRVSCKIDGFRSKDIYCLSNIMNNKTECELYHYSSPFLQSIRTHYPFNSQSLLLLLTPLYQRLISPHPAFSRCSCFIIPRLICPSVRCILPC